MKSSLYKALVADSQSICRVGLAAVLQGEIGFEAVGEASHFVEMKAALSQDENIGLVVLDFALPGMAGTQELRHLVTAHPYLQVVVLAASRDRRTILDVLAAGVHGYIPKDLPSPEMARAFKTILDGQVFLPPIFAENVVESSPNPCAQDGANLLTERQRDVLALLVAGKSNKEIARVLHIAESTVKTHLMAAFRLLGVRNRVGAVMTIQALPRRDRQHHPASAGPASPARRSTDWEAPLEFSSPMLLRAG